MVSWSFSKSKLSWYEYAWAILPLGLTAAGGLLGGICGSAAAALNLYVMRRPRSPALRFSIAGIVSVSAGVLYFLLVKVIAVSLQFLLITDAQIDRDLQKAPSFIALKKIDPHSYNMLVKQIMQLHGQGKPQSEMQAAAQQAIATAVGRYEAHASDQALIERVRIIALEIDQIGAKNADACAAYLSPQRATLLNVQEYITPEVAKLDEASVVAILETGAELNNPIPESTEIAASLAAVRNQLVAAFGEDDVVLFSKRKITDSAKLCKMNSALFRDALSLPRAQSIPFLRFILGHRTGA